MPLLAVMLALQLDASPLRAAQDPFLSLSFDAALEKARAEQRVVLIDFFLSDWPPCEKLDETTWSDKRVREWISEKTVALKIDVEKERELAARFRIDEYPTIVLVGPNGDVLDRFNGYVGPTAFSVEASNALAGESAVAVARQDLKGHEEDPFERMFFASVLAERGLYEEALENYVWSYDHSLEHDWSYDCVSLSFLAGYMSDLGRRYPPALEALRSRRDAAEKRLVAEGNGPLSLEDLGATLEEVLELNRELGESERVLALHRQLATSKGVLAKARKLLGINIDLGKLDQFVAGKQAMLADLERRIAELPQSVEADVDSAPQPGDPPPAQDAPIAVQEKRILEIGAKSFAAVLRTKHDADARQFASLLTKFRPRGPTYALLIDHALVEGRRDVARELASEAARVLKGPELDPVREVVRRIPWE